MALAIIETTQITNLAFKFSRVFKERIDYDKGFVKKDVRLKTNDLRFSSVKNRLNQTGKISSPKNSTELD